MVPLHGDDLAAAGIIAVAAAQQVCHMVHALVIHVRADDEHVGEGLPLTGHAVVQVHAVLPVAVLAGFLVVDHVGHLAPEVKGHGLGLLAAHGGAVLGEVQTVGGAGLLGHVIAGLLGGLQHILAAGGEQAMLPGITLVQTALVPVEAVRIKSVQILNIIVHGTHDAVAGVGVAQHGIVGQADVHMVIPGAADGAHAAHVGRVGINGQATGGVVVAEHFKVQVCIVHAEVGQRRVDVVDGHGHGAGGVGLVDLLTGQGVGVDHRRLGRRRGGGRGGSGRRGRGGSGGGGHRGSGGGRLRLGGGLGAARKHHAQDQNKRQNALHGFFVPFFSSGIPPEMDTL